MKSIARTFLLSVLLIFKAAAAEYVPPSKFAVVIGQDKVPVTLYVYTSFTCNHCADGHAKVLPVIIAKYVKTGKAKIIIEPFPMEMFGSMAAIVLGSLPQEKRLAAMDKLFAKQKEWIGDQHVKKISEICGVDPKVTQKLFDDANNRSALMEVRMYAQNKLKVNATPTVFANGVMAKEPSVKEIEKVIVAALGAKKAV